MAARRKERPISKGLIRRVSHYIRDNSINGVCRQDIETIAHRLGLAVELTVRLLDHLLEQGIIVSKPSENPLLPDGYVYVGEGALTELFLEVGNISDDILAKLDEMEIDQIKEVILDYDQKVRELLYQMQQQTKELEAYHSFKNSIIRTMDVKNDLVYILARKRP